MFNVYKNQLSRQTHQIPTSCLPTLLIFIHIEHTFYICPFLVAFFSATIDGRNLIFGHKLHIGTPYRGKCFFDQSDSYFLLYLYDACDQISDFCHQQLLRKMRRNISWTDGRTNGRTEGRKDGRTDRQR
jgi:hypothetical protein